MYNSFLAADHHLCQASILTFTNTDGSHLRTFTSIDEHDEYIIAQNNKVVGKKDRLYMLGDVTFSKHNLHLLDRMNGRKVLIKGNHDILNLKDYLPYFDDIRAVHQVAGLIMSHIPIHTESLGRWGHNVHGHLHCNKVMLNKTKQDTRYLCVSMEQLDEYTPISLEDVKKKMNINV